MAIFNKDKYFKDFPDLKDLYLRLEDSEKETARIEAERMQSGTKAARKAYADHFCISKYMINGEWKERLGARKSGTNAFVSELKAVIESRNPDAIEVDIYKGSGERSAPAFTAKIALKEGLSGLGNITDKETEKDAHFERLQRMADQISKANENGMPNESQKLVAELEKQMLIQQYEHKLEKAADKSESKIEKLQDLIEEQVRTIQDLEAEIEEKEESLGAIDALNEPDWMRDGVRLLSGVIKENIPAILNHLGLQSKSTEAMPAVEQTTSGADDFKEVGGDIDLSGVDPKVAEAIKNLTTFFVQLPQDQFAKIGRMIILMQDQTTGQLIEPLATQTEQFIRANKIN